MRPDGRRDPVGHPVIRSAGRPAGATGRGRGCARWRTDTAATDDPAPPGQCVRRAAGERPARRRGRPRGCRPVAAPGRRPDRASGAQAPHAPPGCIAARTQRGFATGCRARRRRNRIDTRLPFVRGHPPWREPSLPFPARVEDSATRKRRARSSADRRRRSADAPRRRRRRRRRRSSPAPRSPPPRLPGRWPSRRRSSAPRRGSPSC